MFWNKSKDIEKLEKEVLRLTYTIQRNEDQLYSYGDSWVAILKAQEVLRKHLFDMQSQCVANCCSKGLGLQADLVADCFKLLNDIPCHEAFELYWAAIPKEEQDKWGKLRHTLDAMRGKQEKPSECDIIIPSMTS